MPGGPYSKTIWHENTAPAIEPANLQKIEDALERALANTGVPAGTYTLASVTVDADGRVTNASSGAPGAIADASTTVKGASKLSVAPASPTSPIATGDNDPRVGAATTSQRALVKTSVAAGDPVALLKTDPVMETRVEGLNLAWVSATQISISSGAAWIPSLGYVYNVPSTINLSPALSASAWFYVYLFDNAGTPALEANTTAPASAYKGLARTKTSDTSRRLVGAIRTDGSSNIIRFSHRTDGFIKWVSNLTASPLRVASAVGSATAANISFASAVPTAYCQETTAVVKNLSTTRQLYMLDGDASGTVSSTNYTCHFPSGNQAGSVVPFHLNSSGNITYVQDAADSQVYVDCAGWFNAR